MDKHLNDNEERLFDLVDQKDFDQLTPEEQTFVETHFSEAAYRLQRQLISESNTLYEAVAEVPPLVVPMANSTVFGKQIPLYQAFIGIAATFALFLSIWPDQTEKTEVQNNKPALSKTDTIIQTKIIRDTIIRYKNHRNGNQSAQSSRSEDDQFLATQMRILEANTLQLPEIVNDLNRSGGHSLKDDPASERLLKSTYQSDAR